MKNLVFIVVLIATVGAQAEVMQKRVGVLAKMNQGIKTFGNFLTKPFKRTAPATLGLPKDTIIKLHERDVLPAISKGFWGIVSKRDQQVVKKMEPVIVKRVKFADSKHLQKKPVTSSQPRGNENIKRISPLPLENDFVIVRDQDLGKGFSDLNKKLHSIEVLHREYETAPLVAPIKELRKRYDQLNKQYKDLGNSGWKNGTSDVRWDAIERQQNILAKEIDQLRSEHAKYIQARQADPQNLLGFNSPRTPLPEFKLSKQQLRELRQQRDLDRKVFYEEQNQSDREYQAALQLSLADQGHTVVSSGHVANLKRQFESKEQQYKVDKEHRKQLLESFEKQQSKLESIKLKNEPNELSD